MSSHIDNLSYFLLSWKVLMLVFIRIFVTLKNCTLFNKSLPSFCLAVLSLFLSFFVCSGDTTNSLSLPEHYLDLLLLVFKEAIYGYLLGISFSIPFLLTESVGKLVDQQRGEQFAAIINPQTSNITASSSKLIFQSFIAYFIVNGGILAYLDIIIDSLRIIPINEFLPLNPIIQKSIYIKLFAGYCYWTVILAMPVVIVAIIVDLILGLISSFIPQLNVTVLSIPIKSILLLVVLALCIENILKFPFHLIINLSQLLSKMGSPAFLSSSRLI